MSGVLETDVASGRRRGGMSPLSGTAAAAWMSLDSLKWVTTS